MNVYQASRIDAGGYYLEPELIEEGVIPADPDVILVPVPEGLYRPRWAGSEWLEGLSPEELEERMKPQPIVLTPEQERMNRLETDNLSLMLALTQVYEQLIAIETGGAA